MIQPASLRGRAKHATVCALAWMPIIATCKWEVCEIGQGTGRDG